MSSSRSSKLRRGRCRLRDPAGSKSATRHKQHEPTKPGRKRVALIGKIEFEPFGRKDRRATRSSALGVRKGQRGASEQKDPAGPAPRFARDPQARSVAADEERGDRRAEHVGIRRFEPYACRLAYGIERDRGHDGLLTNLARISANDVVGMRDGSGMRRIGKA